MALSGVMVTSSMSSESGSKNAIGSGTTKSGGTTRGGGARASITTRGPLLAFNLIVEFFCELRHNYKGVRIEKLWSL